MATDADIPQLSENELAALRIALRKTAAAVYFPTTGRVYKCPNLWHHPVPCDRESTFTIPEAELLATRIRAGELGPVLPGAGPVVLVYGIPWSWGGSRGADAAPSP